MKPCGYLDYRTGALELNSRLWGSWDEVWCRSSLDAWVCWFGAFDARCLATLAERTKAP
jgi:hypothetical protein